MSIRQGLFILFSIFSAMLVLQCTSDIAPSQVRMKDEKNVEISFAIKTSDHFNKVAHEAYVQVIAPDIDTIKRPMVITDTMLHGTVSNIPAGSQRRFEILVYDSLFQLQFYGSRSIDLSAGENTQMVIHIGKVSGAIDIIGTISDASDTAHYDYSDTSVNDTPDVSGYPYTVDTGGYYIIYDEAGNPDTIMTGEYIDTLDAAGNPVYPGGYIDTLGTGEYFDTLDAAGNPVYPGGYIDTLRTDEYFDTLDAAGNPVYPDGYIDTLGTDEYFDTLDAAGYRDTVTTDGYYIVYDEAGNADSVRSGGSW